MKIFNKMKSIALLLIIVMQFIFIPLPKAYAATSPSLGTADTYSILAGSAVTNTGSTTISKNVGIYPGTTPPNYTGFGTVTFSGGGSVHDADGVAQTAQADNLIAYGALASQGCNTDYGGGREDLAGKTLVPGVYCAGAFDLTGTLTLNGDADDVWIFKSASDLVLTGGTAVKVLFTGGGNPCNVWWRVVSTATFDANSTLVGNILALTSITFAAGASLDGRALAQNAEVTLSSNSISGPTCAAAATSTSTSTSSNTSAAAPICVDSAPTNNPNLFQIDRSGSKAVLYFTPVNDYLTYYYIAYGFSPGDERFGVSFPASLSKGVVNFTINDLNPNMTYYFKVRGGNECAPGGWSNNKGSDSKNPLLPNTGFAPHKTNILLYITVGLFVGISILFVLFQRKYKYLSKN